jgi:hypothetical protein
MARNNGHARALTAWTKGAYIYKRPGLDLAKKSPQL